MFFCLKYYYIATMSDTHRYKEIALYTKLFLGFVNEYLYTSIKLFLPRRFFSEATTIAKAIGQSQEKAASSSIIALLRLYCSRNFSTSCRTTSFPPSSFCIMRSIRAIYE